MRRRPTPRKASRCGRGHDRLAVGNGASRRPSVTCSRMTTPLPSDANNALAARDGAAEKLALCLIPHRKSVGEGKRGPGRVGTGGSRDIQIKVRHYVETGKKY